MASSNNRVVIDLTQEPKDHLSSIPPELLHLICDSLLPTHDADEGSKHYITKRLEGPKPKHPLDCLAATSKQMQAEVNSWAGHWLKKHRTLTHYKNLNAERQQCRNYLHGKGSLFTWLSKHCVFCGKHSTRPAIFVSGFKCCAKCDKLEWPDKMTKTSAMQEYDLRPHHLLPHQHPSNMLMRGNGQRPTIRYGTYVVQGCLTTMFDREQVKALAEYVHGDLEKYLRQKKAAAEGRKRKRKSRDKKKAEFRPFIPTKKNGDSNEEAMATVQQFISQTGVSPQEIMMSHETPSWLQQARSGQMPGDDKPEGEGMVKVEDVIKVEDMVKVEL